MAREPLGENTYKGLGVPLYGESVVQQQNSSNAVLTLVHSTANAGRFLLFLDYKDVDGDPASSIITDLAVADIDADGGFRVVSGTTVLMELNSSGLFSGSTQLIAPGGGSKYQTVTINSTATTLASSNSGKLHILSTQAATSNFVYFPTSGNVDVGDRWEIIGHTTAVGIWNFSISGLNTGGIIHLHTGTTNVINTTGAFDTTASTGVVWFEAVCISSALPAYVVSKKSVDNVSVSTAAGFAPVFGAGTTA